MSSRRFRQQLDFLLEFGWRTFCIRDLLGSDPLPPRSVLITFDDGFRNNFEEAFIPLVKRGMRATWFIVSDCIGRHAHWMGPESPEIKILQTGQIREIAASGMEIGSHTRTHPDLTVSTSDQVAQEIHGSRAQLEDIFGLGVSCFAYPYGRYDDDALSNVHDAGYSLACGVRPGLADTQHEAYRLRRVSVFAEDSLGTFARKLVLASNDASWGRMVRYTGNRIADRLGLVAR